MGIVLPEWALALDEPLRALVLRHELEHRAARDPYLLLTAAVLTALLPWNIPLWWQARRLRLAIELDCDARVLRARPDPDRYARLLLAIAQRRSGREPSLAPALLEPTSNLERRIAIMRTAPQPATRPRILSLTAVVVAAVATACMVQPPESADGPTGPAISASSADSRDPATGAFFEYQVDKPASAVPGTIRPTYPVILRAAGVEGELQALLVVDTAGLVEAGSVRIARSTNELFSAAVVAAVPLMRFHPAEVRGVKVRQLVEQPFTFQIR